MGIHDADLLEFLIMDKEKGSMRLTAIIVFLILIGVCLYLTIIGFKSGEKNKLHKIDKGYQPDFLKPKGLYKDLKDLYKPDYNVIPTGPYVYLSCTFIMLLCVIFGIYSRFVPDKN